MAAILQIVDRHAGALILELNGWVGESAGFVKRGLNLTEGQLADLNTNPASWSPLSTPTPLGRRRITVPFVLVGTSADELGVRVAKLMQATRGSWWLRVRRHGASQDCWLQCYGCVPQIDSQVTASTTAHIAQGTITCETEPYAVGARVDGGGTVGQDPAASAWGLDVDNVPGDSPTPLLLRMNDSSAFGLDGMGAFISVRRRQTPSNVTSTKLTRQAESGANPIGTDPGVSITTISAVDFSGGSGARATFSAAYTSPASGQITFAAPGFTGPDVPGIYRLFVRVRRNPSAIGQVLVLKPFITGALIIPEDVVVPAGGAPIRMVDLGLIQWPAAQPATVAAPVANPSGAETSSVLLQFWRKSDGAATVDFDFMAWIPADEDAGYLTLDKALPNPSTNWVVLDGYQHLAMVTTASPTVAHDIIGQSYVGQLPTTDWAGGVPRVGPGNNRLFVCCGTGKDTTWPVALNLNVAYSYWPRYTWLR